MTLWHKQGLSADDSARSGVVDYYSTRSGQSDRLEAYPTVPVGGSSDVPALCLSAIFTPTVKTFRRKVAIVPACVGQFRPAPADERQLGTPVMRNEAQWTKRRAGSLFYSAKCPKSSCGPIQMNALSIIKDENKLGRATLDFLAWQG
jgi:hypothetical protein